MLHVNGLTLLFSVILITFVHQAQSKEAFIEMPSPCYSVEEIKKEKVFLKEDEKACAQIIQKTLISVDDSVDQVAVYVKGKLWNTQALNKKDIDLEKIAEAVEDQKKKLEIKGVDNNNDEAIRRASAAAREFYSEQYQSRLNEEMERIKTDLFAIGEKENNEIIYRDAIKAPEQSLGQGSYLYIFVSSSMPENTIRAYVQDIALLQEHNIIIAFRGIVGNPPKIKETAKYIKMICQNDPDCRGKCRRYKAKFAIDPILFENYKITEAPTFVYDRHAEKTDMGRKKKIKNESEYFKLTGDVSIEYALEIFRRETKEKELEKLLSKLKVEYGTKN